MRFLVLSIFRPIVFSSKNLTLLCKKIQVLEMEVSFLYVSCKVKKNMNMNNQDICVIISSAQIAANPGSSLSAKQDFQQK